MFRLIQTSDTRGDCTVSYDVQLDKEYTVKEFLETILKQKADEWGAFYLMVRSKKLFWQNPSCEYRHGKKTGTTWANILIRYGDRKITKVCSDGGWTQMDYYIWLDSLQNQPKVPTEKEENEAMIHLEVKDYCHGCFDFEADVRKESIYSLDHCVGTDTTVRCAHHNRCEAIFRNLERKKKRKIGG